MSELKARGVDDVYIEYYNTGKHELAQVYLKSEADNVITELKEKLKVQTSNAEEAWKLKDVYHTSYAEAVKKLYEKNKELRRHKYNRCLLRSVIAEMNATHFKDLFYGAGSEALADEYNKQITIHYKWQKRWLALAEKFKEAK